MSSKSDNLKLLKTNGINVPDFQVLKYEDITNIKSIIEKLDNNLYAVRSSCNLEDGNTSSFAGQFDTYLNVSKKDLESKIKECFLSLNNDNIITYTSKNNIDINSLEMNVIVQKMVDSKISGVLFTSNPQGILNETVIVVAKGLGENVVSEKKNTTTYYYNNQDNIYYYEGEDILTKEQIDELISTSSKIKELLGDYLDIEFAFDKELYILQARKITTLDDTNIVVLDNSNIVESYPNISLPLTISFVNTIYSNIFKRLVNRVLKKQNPDLDNILNNMTGSVNGRVYYKISNWYTLIKYLPFSKKILPIWQDMMGVKSKTVTKKNIKISKITKIKICINYLKELIHSQKNMEKLNLEFTKINTYYKKHINSKLSNKEIIKLYKEVEEKVLNNWDITLVNDMYAFIFTGLLKKKLKNDELTNKYITGISNIESLKPIKELINLSYNKDNYTKKEFEILKNNYIELYGDRSLEELKLESKTFRTNPEYLDKKIEEYRKDLDKLQTLYENINTKEEVKIHHKFLTKRIESGIKNREISRLNRCRLFGMVREMIILISNNLVSEKLISNKNDIFYLTLDEIFNQDIDYKRVIKERKQKYKNYNLLPAYTRLIFMDKEFDKVVNNIKINPTNINTNELIGTPCSNGIVQGEALVITDINKIGDTKDKILITKMTDPGWVFLIANAKGIISEKGSLLSHTAIISRELKIPSIVGVNKLLDVIHTGDTIEMNANKGIVKIIRK